MAGAKDKEKKPGKEEGGNAALLRRLADEMAALRADIETLKTKQTSVVLPSSEEPTPTRKKRSENDADSSLLTATLQAHLNTPTDAAVLIGHAYQESGEDGNRIGSQDTWLAGGLDDILAPDDATVAQLGAAFASPPKVALLRALLRENNQPAARLGEQAALTTGSLYHHLRELVHAGVLVSAGRNRFALTERGRQTALILFVQAGRPETS